MPSKTHITAAQEFEQSNATTKAFLGGKEKAWMTGQPLQNITNYPTTETRSSIPQDKPTGTSSIPDLTTEQDINFGNNSASSIPLVPCLDGAKLQAQQGRYEGTDEYPDPSSTSATIGSLPAGPSSPTPGDVPCTPNGSVARLAHNAQNLLPSPSPSVEARKQSTNMVDLDCETRETPISEGPYTTRLEDLLAKYGSFEQLEKRLEDAERSKSGASQIAANRSEDALPTPQPARDSPERRQLPSQPDQPRSFDIDLQMSPIATPNKRAQDDSIEPRKRLQSLHEPWRTEPDEARSAPTAEHIGQLRSIAMSPGEIKTSYRRVASRLQHVMSQHGRRGLQVERPRLELLRDACERSDYFYLQLHQLFCFEHKLRGSTSDLDLSDLQKKGLDVLGYLLVSNEQLAPDGLQWFSVFPFSLDGVLSQKPRLYVFHERIIKCLEKLAMEWENLKTQCRRRRYPPLVDELFVLFDMNSFTLQKVVFTAILREIWIGPQDVCFEAMENAFLKNYKAVTSRKESHIHVIQAYNQLVINEYEGIVGQHVCHLGNRTLPPHHFGHTNLSAVQDSGHHRAEPPPQTCRPGATRPSSLQIDIQAAQRDTRTTNSNVSIAPTPSASGPQTAPVVGMWSPSTHTPFTVAYQSPIANGPSTPQSAPLAPFPGTMQPLRNRAVYNNGSDSMYGQGQHRSQSMSNVGPLGSLSAEIVGSSAQMDAPLRRASHVLPSNAPGRAGPGLRHIQQRNPGTEQRQPQQHHIQTTSPQHHTQVFNAQPAMSRPQHLASSHPNQFIRFDPSLQPAQPNPDLSALHQAHVRSPVLVLTGSEGKPTNATKYFTFISTVIMPVEVISSKNRHVSWDFTMPSSYIEYLARNCPSSYGAPVTRILNSESLLCRIRCIALSNSLELPSQSEWAASDNIWPGSTAVILNGNALEIRKKSHHGKDLPIDITSLVKEGKNSLSTAVIGLPKDSHLGFAIGVEIIQVADEEQIKNNVRTIPLHEARQRIINQSIHIDSDIEVVHSRLVIDLTDPYTASLFVVPVRGSSCRHNQCFDLDVFLHSRNIEKPSQPCGPDTFRCPICGADARPQSLVVDGFFVAVRQELERNGRLDVKAIILHESGNWEIKAEDEAKGEQGDGTGKRAGRGSVGRQSVPTEVIEIDDD